MKVRYRRIFVDVPVEAGKTVEEAIFDAVADAAYEAQPKVRDGWDVMVYSSGYVEEEL